MSELVDKPKLGRTQYQFLLYCEQFFWRKGQVPSYNQCIGDGLKITEEFYAGCFGLELFCAGLAGRGIPEHLVDEAKDWAGVGSTSTTGSENEELTIGNQLLTEKQMTVANTMLDVLDRRSRIKKLTELGVTTAEYNSWLKQPAYRRYCLDRTEELLQENQHIAHLSLIDRVTQGDLGAIKYFNSMTGRYRERERAGVEINVQNNYGQDKLIAIVEIIQRHVKDPKVLDAIADDILALQQSQNIGAVSASQVAPMPYRAYKGELV